MFDRVLTVNVERFINLTERFKWRFYETNDDRIRVIVPRGDNENLVLYVEYSELVESTLVNNGFIKQDIQGWREY